MRKSTAMSDGYLTDETVCMEGEYVSDTGEENRVYVWSCEEIIAYIGNELSRRSLLDVTVNQAFCSLRAIAYPMRCHAFNVMGITAAVFHVLFTCESLLSDVCRHYRLAMWASLHHKLAMSPSCFRAPVNAIILQLGTYPFRLGLRCGTKRSLEDLYM